MANNFAVLDGAGASKTIKTTDNAGVHTPHHNVDAIAAGASADIGAVADSAVITDTTGSLSGKLRGVVKWAFERMPTALGQTTMSASLPVAIASNQTGIPLSAGNAMIGGIRLDGPFQIPYQKYTTSVDMSGAAVSITNAAVDTGKRVIVDELSISVGTTMEVTLKEETSGTVFGSFFILANTSFAVPNKIRCQVANKRLQAQSSVSGQIRISVDYHEET